MTLKALCFAALMGAAATVAQADDLILYTMKSSVTLPSSNTDWDYIKAEPNTSRLFMARDKDGLTVFDMDKNAVITTVENSVGANGPLLLPHYNRGYVAMTDGSLLSFELDSLKVLARVHLSDSGGLNSGIYDPVTRQIHFISGTREKDATWYSFDPATGRETGRKTFPFRKMDDPAADGKGHLYAPARLDNLLLRLDSKTLSEQARWDIGCRVSKVRYQASTNRILGACTGDDSQFFAFDPVKGEVIARVPIGLRPDGFVVDETRGRIMAASMDGTLTVVKQDGPDAYRLEGTIATRLGARTMELDRRNGHLIIVNADYTHTPAKDGSGDVVEVMHPDSFVVMTYVPQ